MDARAEPASVRRNAVTAAEVVAVVGGATGAVFALDTVAPIAGLGVVYLLGVLLVSIRRGEIAGLAAAVLSVLALNFFFIEPVHRLTISDSENVVSLAVFLVVAAVVGRLAATSRESAREA
jgi:two-component system sensor histidine kinase KdpD